MACGLYSLFADVPRGRERFSGSSGAVGLCGHSPQLTEAGSDSAPRSRRPARLPFAQRGPE